MDILTRCKQTQTPVLDHGFVRLVDCMPRLATVEELETGLDHRIVEVARISTGNPTKPGDTNLIRYLYEHKHVSPFEFAEFTFLIKAPIFVRTHLYRHRTASVNEESARYQAPDAEKHYYHLSHHGARKQAKTNRQSSVVDADFADTTAPLTEIMDAKMSEIIGACAELRQAGVANELSRVGMPVATYVSFYYKMNLRNLLHMLSLRYAPDAQWETQEYAKAILEMVEPLYPATFQAWRNYGVGSLTLYKEELEALQTGIQPSHWTKREREGFMDKCKRLVVGQVGEL